MPAEILVIAGVNGAGKSSVAGVALESHGGVYYNPDTATRTYVEAGLPLEEANARAWRSGVAQLERAIDTGSSYAFETTLGGQTVTRLLIEAAKKGLFLRVWYVGLVSAKLHIERVHTRVAAGGHDIPEARIKARWTTSRENLVRLLPHVGELALYDNSVTVDLAGGQPAEPTLLLHARSGAILTMADPSVIPLWARPLLTAALKQWMRP